MRKIILSTAFLSVLILTGCGDAEPTPAEQATTTETTQENQVQEVAPVETETVAAENVSVINESVGKSESKSKTVDSNEMTMAAIENKLESVQFAFDEYALNSEMKERISSHAEVVNGSAKTYMIKLEGNCDEWGSDEYNFALGLKRADAVKKALIAEGVDANRLTVVSYGESNPLCSDKTQACWAKNRRVDFKLLP